MHRACARRPRRPCRAAARSALRRPRTGAPAGAADVGASGGRAEVQNQPGRAAPQHTRGAPGPSSRASGAAAEQLAPRPRPAAVRPRRSQLRAEHVRVVRIEHRRLDRPAEHRLRMVGQVGVQRVVARRRTPRAPPRPDRPARPACCQSEARVPGKPASTTASSPLTSTPSSSALVAATPEQRAVAQAGLQRAPLLGQVAGRGRPRPAAASSGRRLGQPAPRASRAPSAPRRGRDRTKASVRAPSTTRSASSRAASAPAERRTGAPCSPRNAVSGGSHSANVVAPRGEPSSVTAVTGSADQPGGGRRPGRTRSPTRARTSGGAVRRADPPQPPQHCATCDPKTPR